MPSGPQTGIKLNPRDVRIESGALTAITLDFDADKSIVKLGGADHANRDYHFILKPVIFILEATGAILVDTETLAFGLNFPTGLQFTQNVGADAIIGEGSLLVANAGASGQNSNTALDMDISGTLPVDATVLTPFVSSLDEVEVAPGEFEPLVNSPSGVSQYSTLVWISNLASVVAADHAGTVSEIYTNGSFSSIFIDNHPPSSSAAGLVATAGIEFGGSAPDGSLSGAEWLIFQVNGNGSVTGLDLKESRTFDVLAPTTLVNPSDLAFVPEPIFSGDSPGTVLGRLYVTDASSNELVIVRLTTVGGNIGDATTEFVASIESSFVYEFASEPIGVDYSHGSDRLYLANRGNGTVIAIRPDGFEIETYDTGLGANALSGVDVWFNGSDDVVFLTNTAGNDDPSNDAPGVGMSTLEKVVIPIP